MKLALDDKENNPYEDNSSKHSKYNQPLNTSKAQDIKSNWVD